VPPVDAAKVSALGKKIPVLESPLGLIDGAAADPAETVVIPDAFTPVTLILGVPESPVAFPVKFPLKVVAVSTPVTDAPLGKDGAPVPVLFFIESTFNCDIFLLLFF
jgi:hypothetical protein